LEKSAGATGTAGVDSTLLALIIMASATTKMTATFGRFEAIAFIRATCASFYPLLPSVNTVDHVLAIADGSSLWEENQNITRF